MNEAWQIELLGTFCLRHPREPGWAVKRFATHRINIAQRVRRGDLTVGKRIVHDRREEIHGLHERAIAVQPEHTRIVRGPIVDQDPVVAAHGQIAQDLGELTSGEFARSTGAGCVIRQFLHVTVRP